MPGTDRAFCFVDQEETPYASLAISGQPYVQAL